MNKTFGCNKDSTFKARALLESVVSSSLEAEKITAHPYVKFQKARILQLIDSSKILGEYHNSEIIQCYRDAIFTIKTVEQYNVIQNTKSYASLLWIFGLYLAENEQKLDSIRYLEESKNSFEALNLIDDQYYQCLSKLGALYLDYYEEDKESRIKYLRLSRQISNLLNKYYSRFRRQRI